MFISSMFIRSGALSDLDKTTSCHMSVATVKLDTIKTIRRAYDCKFQDVILSLIASALKRYLQEYFPTQKVPKMLQMSSPRDMPGRGEEICNAV